MQTRQLIKSRKHSRSKTSWANLAWPKHNSLLTHTATPVAKLSANLADAITDQIMKIETV
jgi:hypothetical protein